MSYSTTGGASWTVPLNIYTPANRDVDSASTAGGCQTNASPPTFYFSYIDNSGGIGHYHFKYTTCTLIATGVSPCAAAITGTTNAGSAANYNGGNSIIAGCSNWPGFECAQDSHAPGNLIVFQNGVNVFNNSGLAPNNAEISFNGNFYVLVITQITGATGTYFTSTTGAKGTWSVGKSWSSANGGNMLVGTSSSSFGFGSWLISSPATLNVVVAYVEKTMGGNCALGGTYCIETVSIGGGGAATTTIGDTNGGNQCQPQIISDGVNWAITCVNVTQSTYAITTNNGLTYTVYSFNSGGSSFPTGGTYVASGGSTSLPFSMGAYPVVEVSQAANYNVYVQMFGTFTGTSGGGTTNVTLGSCPTKNTATFALTNSTEFMYTATALGGTIVSQISVEIASVNSGHVANEKMYLMLYATAQPGAVSVTNPMFLVDVATGNAITLSATSSPQLYTTLITSGPAIVTGATYGIAILGNTKILVNQSSLAGMVTIAAGGANPGTPQSSAVTSLTSTTTQLYFCGNGNFQNVNTTTVTSTSTITTTVASITSTVCTTTATTTATSIDINTAASTASGFTLIILVLLIPALALGIPMSMTKNPGLSILGFMGGLGIGAGAGNYAGIVPAWLFATVVISIIFMLVGAIMLLRGGGNAP